MSKMAIPLKQPLEEHQREVIYKILFHRELEKRPKECEHSTPAICTKQMHKLCNLQKKKKLPLLIAFT